MHKELIERVAKAIAVDAWNDIANKDLSAATVEAWRNGVRRQSRRAIEAYEQYRQEAQDAEDERLYTEFHK